METNTQNHAPIELRITRCNSIPQPPALPTPQGRSRPEHRFLPPASAIAASGLEGKIQPGDHSFFSLTISRI